MSTLSGLPPIVLGLLNNMDKQGEQILGTYMYGGGKPHDVYDDPIWSPYMMANNGLRRQVLGRVMLVVKALLDRKSKGRFPVSETFHAECPENNDFSGYAFLHGTNQTVGDFKVVGWAEVEDAVDPEEGAWDIHLDLRYVFNDIVDPNGNYAMDSARNIAAQVVTLGQATAYRLSISWGAKSLCEVRPGKPVALYGYPSDLQLPVRPLPRGKLDVWALEREHAKEIEAKIMQQLRKRIAAHDISAMADRKRRLLWLFYRLSGPMGATYRERIAKANHNDELVRLLRDRISSALRAELMAALRGERPTVVEPSS